MTGQTPKSHKLTATLLPLAGLAAWAVFIAYLSAHYFAPLLGVVGQG